MQPRNDVVRLRLTTAEREAWSRAAGGKGRLSEWVRATCNTASLQDQAPAVRSESDAPGGPKSEVESGLTRPLDDVLAEIDREERGKCARWMHHRKGVYCGTCKQVN